MSLRVVTTNVLYCTDWLWIRVQEVLISVGAATMIEVDYTNYCSIQAEWAAGLLRAAGHPEFMPEGYCEDMTAIAKGIQARLKDGRHYCRITIPCQITSPD